MANIWDMIKDGYNNVVDGITGEDDQARTPAAPAAPQPAVAPVAAAPASAPQDNGGVDELTAQGILNQYAVPRANNYKPKLVQYEDLIGKSNDKERENEFKTSLEELKDNYSKQKESAARRQMYAEMLAAIGNNIGTITAGAQAMNTKANVQPIKNAPINVRDQVAAVDKRYDKDYDNLLKRYKDLKDGGLTAKDILNARISNAYLEQGAEKMNTNASNVDRNAGINVGKAVLKDQKDNELSDKEKSAVDDMDNTLAQIDSVIGNAANFKDKLGPNQAIYQAAKEGSFGVLVPGKIDPEYVKFRSDAKALKGAYQKVISGLTVSDAERKELDSYIPHEGQPYETFMANAEAFKKRVAEIRARNMKNSKKYQGKNIEGYKDDSKEAPAATSSAPNGQDVVERNGKTYKWNPAANKYQLLVK